MDPSAAAREAELPTDDLDLEGFLAEFDQVLRDFDKAEASPYGGHLEELKSRLHPGTYDSGIEESESSSTSPGSSLNTSEEDVHTLVTVAASSSSSSSSSRAKLGDTQELEDFIADLDKVLEDM